MKLREVIYNAEKQFITRILEINNWNKKKVAKILGIGLSSLYRKITELGISKRKKK